VADRKSRNQHKDLFPVLQEVNGRQCQDKKLVVESAPANDMFPAKAKIEAEITHSFLIAIDGNFNACSKQEFKIIQSFVIRQIILLMASPLYQWLLIPCFGLMAAKVGGYQPMPTSQQIHPYYVSVVEINHNSGDKTLEISCKIFTNDFEATLERNYKTKIDLTHPADKAAIDRFVSDYIRKRLSLKVDGKPVALSYVGFESQEEAVLSFFQVDNVPGLKRLDITNSILHDFSDQQINIIHCTVAGKRQSTKLDYPNTNAGFDF
jgi:hypothetical protein